MQRAQKGQRSKGRLRPLLQNINFATISVAVNVVLAIIAGYSAYTASRLDNDKKTLEQQLLVQKYTPTISAFYIRSEVQNWEGFFKSKDALPFTNGIQKYRIFQNLVFDKLSADVSSQHRDNQRPNMITFLVITNASDVTAYATVVEAEGSANASLGDLEGNSAILIPMTYQPATSGQETRAPEYQRLRYEGRIASIVQNFTRQIPKELTPAWTPILGNMRGWARAAPEEEDHLRNLRPGVGK